MGKKRDSQEMVSVCTSPAKSLVIRSGLPQEQFLCVSAQTQMEGRKVKLIDSNSHMLKNPTVLLHKT